MTAGDVYRALWRHKVLILVLTAVCVGATWYVTSRETKKYEASALVRIQERGEANSFAALDASVAIAQTYAAIINSGTLTRPAKDRTRRRVPARLVNDADLSANPVTDLPLIWISAKGRHPAGVAAIANASPAALQNAARRYGTPGDEIVTVTKATVPSSAISPDTTLNVALALALGLMFNCGLVLIFEVLRDRLPETDELEESLGYPVLASIPTLRLKPVGAIGESGGDGFDDKRALVAQAGGSDGRREDDAER